MTDKKSSRRKLLKSIAASSGAVVAGKSLPESWSKPIVNSVMLPAHAEATTTTTTTTTTVEPTTTPHVCCAGVFCDLDFGQAPIGGVAQVSSDCTISMEGGSEGGDWSGSGAVEADGSFSIVLTFEIDGPALATGTVSSDCSTINGTMGPITFSGVVSPGLTDPSQCF